MSNESAATAAFDKAREIYTSGVKSSNKLHLPVGSTLANRVGLNFEVGLNAEDPAYVDCHLEALKLVNLERDERIAYKHKGDAFDRGRLLRLTRSKAHNCNELALIAAEWAHRTLGKPKPAPIALVSLSPPADHIFCVVGPRDKLQGIHGTEVWELEFDVASDDDLWAVDPWLNVCCNMEDYGLAAKSKCKKWQLAGKRVAWHAGPLGAGWYSPQGAYSDGFQNAALVVELL